MPWHARLELDYQHQDGRTTARFRHEGPLRVLQPLYPEGDAVCHHVMVHPPSGLVGGDVLDIDVRVARGAHALVTTPGASRFYRSEGAAAVQQVSLRVEPGARLEWLPLESICYSGCQAENRLALHLAPGGEALGWDITALGLPAAGQPFVAGRLLQHVEIAGTWLERGRIDAGDARLLDGPLGLAGYRCLATLFFATGEPMGRSRREQALEAARACIEVSGLPDSAGATAPNPRVVVVRALSPLVEPAMHLVQAVRRAWRPLLWQLPPTQPRTWAL